MKQNKNKKEKFLQSENFFAQILRMIFFGEYSKQR